MERGQHIRRDIDGLRAIAVFAVVLGHAKFVGFGGGYLGVDVFFVISGFLITGILLRDDKFDLLHFYERRIRRIVPALAVVLAASSLVAIILLSPFELKEYARTLLASTGFAVNIYYTKATSYFAPKFATPLLHLWSLSVEEQFYIVYPLFLFAFKRWAPKLLCPALVAVFLLSLILSQWLSLSHINQAFYFTGSRTFELMLGALVALKPGRQKLSRAVAEGVAAAGLLLIVLPVGLYNSQVTWPGWHALVPCVGTALLLSVHSQHQTQVSRLLSTRAFVGLGLISYSLYLWHWPLFEFYSRAALRAPSQLEYAGLIGAATAVAILSWRYVEQPWRMSSAPRRQIFVLAGLCAALFVTAGGTLLATQGLPERFSPQSNKNYALLDTPNNPAFRFETQSDTCFVETGKQHGYPFETCFRVISDRPNVVLWGDSLARNLFSGLRAPMAAAHLNLIQATFGSCIPALHDDAAEPSCLSFNHELYRHLDDKVQTVIIAARFYTHENVVPAVVKLAHLLGARGIAVVVIGVQPEYSRPLPLLVDRYLPVGDNRSPAETRSLINTIRSLDQDMRRQFTGIPNVTYISAIDALCGKAECPVFVGKSLYAYDERHLTLEGSKFAAARLWPEIYQAIEAVSSRSSSPRRHVISSSPR